MSLTPGTRLGPYEIIAPIGAGGMGEVYRATDSNLKRSVAIKVLPASVAADKDRLARFQREAEVLAALNHPNIAAIYGLERTPDLTALVMELVDGDDLSAIIARGPIALVDALPIARQIVDALEAAHEQGIVHRDLKPANIKVRADGTVKVLDFGLAKASDPSTSSSSNVANSPTMTSPAMTGMGMILGTAAYMAPEQAKGRAVDKRADIWAFGVVLYEMLTGRRAFAGDDVSELLVSVLRDTPDLSSLPSGTPPRIAHLLQRCLEKEPKLRLRDIGEARVLLSDSPSNITATPASVANRPVRSTRPSFVTIAAAGLVMAAIAAGATWFAMRSESAPVSLSPAIVKITTDAGYTIEPAVSPSGSLIAYASDRGGAGLDIWVQPLPAGEPVQITRNAANDRMPNFSPDGSRIVFRSDRDGGGIYEVPALGGTERLIAARGRTPKFSPDGKWIAYWVGGRAVSATTWITDGRGGAPRAVGTNVEFAGTLWCRDGKSIIGVRTNVARTSPDDWYAVDIESGVATKLGLAEILTAADLGIANPEAWLGDEIVFSDSTGSRDSLWAVPMNGCSGVAGAPHRLTTGTPKDLSPAVVSTADGVRLFYSGGDERTNIYRLPLPAAVDAPAVLALTDDAAYDSWPSISVDGRKLAFGTARSGSTHTVVRDLSGGTSVDVAATSNALSGAARTSVISPDGASLAMISDKSEVRLQPISGGDARSITIADEIRRLWDWPRPMLITASWSASDGRAIAFALNLETGKPLTIVDSPASKYLGHARLSPDGKWMSLMDWFSADRGRLIVVPYDGVTTATAAQIIPITDGQTVVEENVWSPNGDALYVVSEADGYRCIWSRRLDPRTKQPAGPLTPVAHFHRSRQQIVSTADSPQRLDMSAAGLVFAITERQANIWMATVKR